MKKVVSIAVPVLALLLLAGCGWLDDSPKIVCMVDGKRVPTGFTFKTFREAVEKEHGDVEFEDGKFIRSHDLPVDVGSY